MERYLTDAVYARRVRGRPPELEREEKHLYAELSARISGEDYLRIEEELNHFHEELGKELFGRGFMSAKRQTAREKHRRGKTADGQGRAPNEKLPRLDEWTNVKYQKLIASKQKHKSDLYERDRRKL